MVDNNKKKTIFNIIPEEGFIKIPKTGSVVVSSGDRVVLVRKANELMNKKDYNGAKRIYLAIEYSAGLIRLGDYYENNGNTLEALKMYKAAKAQAKLENISKKMADVLRVWLKS
ncbi:hypothetical protein EW093_15805 [Thiospirochaeta perfilievii]|uniref:Uncharacterized protein n=1 Tax=Thiospirochaeta perfilievii TaxID=252967 RepID=A0A5C1QHQ1_9SPIO|nr:hypothetical protein [Thiospirochaeta perfilievii]QEN06086.1 hypothetical protein EW093_15805 [Thiospirochaeta perfilievii]